MRLPACLRTASHCTEQSNSFRARHLKLGRDFFFSRCGISQRFHAKLPVSDQVDSVSEYSDSVKENYPFIANSFPTKAMADRVASCSVAELSRTGNLCSAALALSRHRLESRGQSVRCFRRFPKQKKSS